MWRAGAKLDFEEDIESLRKKLKITSKKDTIDFDTFKNDITKRKVMLKELGQEERRLNENLRTTVKLKNRSCVRLTYFSDKYHRLIKVNIVLIQRWYRGVKSR